MENHPIPQDVTGFKFRLIGSITLKQFLYLLGAGGIDLALYFLPIPLLLKIPLMGIPAIIALALAFVPIDGRPMDKMIMNFLRALPAENEYIFKKHGVDMPYFAFVPPVHTRPAAQQTDSRIAQKTVLFNQLSRSYFNADEEESKNIQNVTSLFQSSNTPATPTSGFVNRVINADEPPAPSSPAPIPMAAQTPKPDLIKPVMPPVNTAAPQHSKPTQEAQVAPVPPVATPTTPAIQAVQPVSQSATTAPRASYESPNVIEGIVRDPRGKPLPHVIVEILDENNIPKRTFRTSQNGMFISATPMAPGTYTIHLEDTLKKQDFEDKKIEVNGSVLPVIEIVSVDQREKLRRELFGQTA